MEDRSYDAIVVGSGPNGLAAAIRLAQEGLSVLLLEARQTLGGGTRSAEVTLPGFVHDLCSAVHPLAAGSPFFRQLGLEQHGLRWLFPEAAVAHPLEEGRAVVLLRSVEATARELGVDAAAYQQLMGQLVLQWDRLAGEILRPILHWPEHPATFANFGWRSLRSAIGLARSRFRESAARALFGGLAAHSFLRSEQVPSAAFGLVLGLTAHAVGWPIAQGGSQQIANALAAKFRALGGTMRTGWLVETLEQLPKARAVLFDVTPRQLLRLCGSQLPSGYARKLQRFRYGPGVFKIDYALHGPIPWKATECGSAGTVHLGGTLEEIAAAEGEVTEGRLADRPFVLLAQPSLFDSGRAPAGRHTAWAYCHVPNGSTADVTDRIERQIERFAPGFRDQVLDRHTINCAQLEDHNPNCVGGDINGGLADLWQLLARPVLSATPYRIPVPGLYLCSSSTPPGGGVHGMCGYHAAETALADWFR